MIMASNKLRFAKKKEVKKVIDIKPQIEKPIKKKVIKDE